MKRKEIIKRAHAHIKLLDNTIADHEKNRKAALKANDENSASYHWGRISGLVDGINTIKVLIEHLAEDR